MFEVWEVYVMTKHMETKHKVQKIRRTEFNELLNEAMLTEKEEAMMRMHYVERKDINYIADTLGYSKAGILKMHKRILERMESLL